MSATESEDASNRKRKAANGASGTALEVNKPHKKLSRKERSASAGCLITNGQDVVSGNKRCCMQDAIMNAAKRVGVSITRRTLLEQCPAHCEKDTSLGQLLRAECVRESLSIRPESSFNQKKKTLFNLLKSREGVFICHFILHYEHASLEHAVIFDAAYKDDFHSESTRALICNGQTKNLCLLEKADLSARNTAHKAVNDFLGATARLKHIWRVQRKDMTF